MKNRLNCPFNKGTRSTDPDSPVVDNKGITHTSIPTGAISTLSTPSHTIKQAAQNEVQKPTDSDIIIPGIKFEGLKLPVVEQNVSERIDEDSKELNSPKEQNAIESDRDYRKLTNRIIDETSGHLQTQVSDKKPLRITLMVFVIALLALQFFGLLAMLFLNQRWKLGISDQIIVTYIVSLFVETLTGLFIMIRFAFDSTQEGKLIEILNNIVEHFKKYEDK